MTIDELSKWIDSHQLLVVSVLVPLVSAIVAAIASWYSTRKALKAEKVKMSHEATLKIAEFRQQWINSLRDEMAAFQSYGILPDFDPSKERLFYQTGTKIELMMNPKDPDFQALQNAMYGFLTSAKGDTNDKYTQNPIYVEICQRILKREWARLKDDTRQSLI